MAGLLLREAQLKLPAAARGPLVPAAVLPLVRQSCTGTHLLPAARHLRQRQRQGAPKVVGGGGGGTTCAGGVGAIARHCRSPTERRKVATSVRGSAEAWRDEAMCVC